MSKAVEVQMLIMFYKSELAREPECVATKALLVRNRAKLKEMSS